MPTSCCKPSLSYQILSLLKEHGPVSIELLHRMTEPPSPKKNLRQSLLILRKKGLINQVNINSQMTFYHLSQSKDDRENIADRLNVSSEGIKQPLLRKQDWIHNQWCEYWVYFMKSMFPEAKVIRENSIHANDVAQRVLQLKARDFDLMPDFLIRFDKAETTESIHIAFEIERTRKSNKRLLRKMRKYLNGTKVDGLIYICDSGRLSETIRLLYLNRLVAQAHRVKHYGDNFFLFSDSFVGRDSKADRLFNAKGDPVELKNWITILRNTKWTRRRDDGFIRIEPPI